MSLELYIRNKKVDLGEDSNITLSRTFTDYKNPTSVRNTTSTSITLPGTNNNNKIFDQIRILSRIQTENTFKPNHREPFYLLNAGTLVDKGYFKIDSIIYNNTPSYNITLYGELGNLLYHLTYEEDPTTYAQRELTLGDLDYDIEYEGIKIHGFKINKELVYSAWQHLVDPKDSDNPLFDTFNFCIAYNGVQSTDNFDPSIFYIRNNTEYEDSFILSTSSKTEITKLPRYFNKNNNPTEDLNSAYYYSPTNGLVQFELEDEITDLEARDFRSYLQRPIIRLRSVINAIVRYTEGLGYKVELIGEYFSSEDYNDTWITLDLLTELNENVSSNTEFTFKDLLQNTNTPATYLLSLCKSYNIYIDINTRTNTVSLTQRKNFYRDEITKSSTKSSTKSRLPEETLKKTLKKLEIDEQNKTITPLSFDKRYYSFDFAESDNPYIKEYKDKYEYNYGSKLIYPNYPFSTETEEYIKDNVFRNGIDFIQQSLYYRDKDRPRPLAPIGSAYSGTVENQNPGTIITGHYLNPNTKEQNDFTIYAYDRERTEGYYITEEEKETGLYSARETDIWYDSYPRPDFSDDGEPTESNNILIRYTGPRSVYSSIITSQGWIKEPEKQANKVSYSTDTKIKYNISDDIVDIQYTEQKQGYIYVSESSEYTIPIDVLPTFSINKYEYKLDEQSNLIEGIKSTETSTITDNTVYLSTQQVYTTNGVKYKANPEDGIPSYAYTSRNVTKGHRYAVLSYLNINKLTNTTTSYITTTGGTEVDKTVITKPNTWYLSGLIFDANAEGSITIKFPDGYLDTEIQIASLTFYDLTELGIYVSSISELVQILGSNKGKHLVITRSNWYGDPRKLYTEDTILEQDVNIYDNYWRSFITDLYNVNTRILKTTSYLGNYVNINDLFHYFYEYDNCYWILSEITNYNVETGFADIVLIKVNKISNYTD